MNGRYLLAAVVVLTVAMGVGRFAYTPLLPLMQKEAGLSHAMGGFVASSNLAGYLLGALSATAPVFHGKRLLAVRAALVAVAITTALMAFPSAEVWLAARFATGVASGLAFVLGSSIILDRALAERKPQAIAIFYSGVGLGIVLSAIAVPLLARAGGWQTGWLGMAAIAAVLCSSLVWLDDRQRPQDTGEGQPSSSYPALYWWLLAAYTGNGMGYIIPATFIVAMIAATPALMRYADASWIVVGLVAMPSAVFWNRIGLRIGRDRALATALAVMGAGAVAPIVAPNALGVAVAAVTLGGTFLGVTALANALGHELAPYQSQVAIGRLTTSFGVGQIIGPAVGGALLAATESYAPALIVAAAVLGVSAIVMVCGSLTAGS